MMNNYNKKNVKNSHNFYYYFLFFGNKDETYNNNCTKGDYGI